MAKDQTILYRSNASKVKADIPNVLRKALTTVGLQAERYAKQYIRNQDAVDTGLLRNSVTFAIGGETARVAAYQADKPKGNERLAGAYDGTAPADPNGEVSVYIGTNVEYARFVEMGTTRMPARPFIKPAAVDHADEYQQMVKDTMQEG